VGPAQIRPKGSIRIYLLTEQVSFSEDPKTPGKKCPDFGGPVWVQIVNVTLRIPEQTHNVNQPTCIKLWWALGQPYARWAIEHVSANMHEAIMYTFADLVPYWASGGVCRTRACRTMACRTRACQTRARLSNEGLSNGGLSNEGWPGGMCTLFCLGWPRAMGICSSFGCRVWANCTANILHGMSHAHSQTLYVGQVVRVLGPSGGKTLKRNDQGGWGVLALPVIQGPGPMPDICEQPARPPATYTFSVVAGDLAGKIR